MEIHILDVGCGSMAILLNPDGTRFVMDCNLTEDNKADVLAYAEKVLGRGNSIDAFINTHRDADHMRGITDLHDQHTIKQIKDSDVPGTTTDSPEYKAYMQLRRSVAVDKIEPRKYTTYGNAKYRWMNANWDDYTDVNQQSVVVKVEYKTPTCSVMFTGDTDYRPWKEKILPHYAEADLNSGILIAPHHGSVTFFDDPSDTRNYYVEHIQKVKPAMTLISVGPNQFGFPETKAVELYAKYSSGSKQGNKVFTTEEKGNMKIVLNDDGGWSLSVNQ